MLAQSDFLADAQALALSGIDSALLRTGIALLVLVVVAFAWWRPWESRDPMPAGDWVITYVDNSGRLAERREHVWPGIKTDEEAIRNLQGRYPNALDIRHSPPPRFSLKFSRAEWYFIAAAVAPMALLGIGGLMRRQNRLTQRVGSLLRQTVETNVNDLLSNSEFTREQIEKAVRRLNNSGLGFFVWNRDSDTIVDGRLRSTYLHIERCESCGASVGLRIEASLKAVPRCSYCGSAVSTHEHLNALKQKALHGIRNREAVRGAPLSVNRPMSMWLFVFLIILCWPAAVAYAVYKSSLNRAVT